MNIPCLDTLDRVTSEVVPAVKTVSSTEQTENTIETFSSGHLPNMNTSLL